MLANDRTRQAVFSLAGISSTFATRMKGQEAAALLIEHIASVRPALIIVNWEGVRVASPSFIDEFIANIEDKRVAEPNTVVFTNAEPEIAELLEVITRRRNYPALIGNPP